MIRGRDTHNVRVDKQLISEILTGCSDRDTIEVIFSLTRDLALGRITLQAFDDFCAELPCVLWQPSDPDQRHITVAVTRELERKLITISRAVWTITRQVVSAQGPALRGSEEVMHKCGHNGVSSTGYGACLNPAHLLRGTEKERLRVASARRTAREVGVQL